MVTVQNVTDFFQFKGNMRSVDMPDNLKKQKYTKMLVDLFPQSRNINHHHVKLNQAISKLVSYFDRRNSRSIIWVGGSYPKGKIKSTHTDLDFYIALPHLPNEDDRLTELQIIKDIRNMGFLISEAISPFTELLPVLKTGRGLARLSGFTADGIELDFHFLGIKDAEELHYAKAIRRVRSVIPYPEWRVSYTGKKQLIVKPSEIVLNWFHYKGEVVKGFYMDNLAPLGKLTYDPKGLGTLVSRNVWHAVVVNYVGNNEKVSFTGFLKSLYYQYKHEYSNEKLAELEYKYGEALCQLN